MKRIDFLLILNLLLWIFVCYNVYRNEADEQRMVNNIATLKGIVSRQQEVIVELSAQNHRQIEAEQAQPSGRNIYEPQIRNGGSAYWDGYFHHIMKPNPNAVRR